LKLPRRPYLNIVGHWKIWYAISGAIFIISIVALFTRGLNFGIDFTGGTEITVKAASGATIAQVRGAASKLGYGGTQIQSSGRNTFIIRTPELNDQKKTELINALGQDKNVNLQKDAEGKFIADIKDVGPGWGAQVTKQAIIGLAIFILAVLIYISLRFEFKMAVTAIIEIVHDFVITIGIYCLLGREVTPATVIAVLTILGYSLYDTIVIFDRVKENTDQLTRQSKKTYSQTVNDSVNQVLVRSINTSLVTLIPILAILIFGGATLAAFAFPLFIGVLSGTYSSIILAPPVLSQLKETEPKYRTYRERVEKGQAKGAPAKTGAKATAAPVTKKAASWGASPPAGPGLAKAQPKKKPASAVKAKSAPKPQPTPKPKQAPGPGPAAAKAASLQNAEASETATAPKPKPKPQQKKAAQPTSKNLAKSRTKGPGSGKKKKKKK
jgi:preprotein translocase subunit SecF